MIKAHWIKFTLFVLAGCLLAFVFATLQPKKYEGFVQILIDQKPVVQNYNSTSIDQQLSDLLDFSRPRSIGTQVAQLTSYGVLGAAGEQGVVDLQISGGEAQDFLPEALGKSVTVDADTTSDIITLRIRMRKPEWAQDLAGRIYEENEKLNNRNSRELTGRAVSFLEAQQKEVKTRVDEIDSEVFALRTKYQIADVSTTLTSKVQLAAAAEQQLRSANVDAAGADRRVVELTKLLANEPKNIVSSTQSQYNPTLQGVEARLAEAETQYAAALSTYTEGNPELLRAKAVVDQLRKDREGLAKRITSGAVTSINPTRSQLETSLNESKAQYEAAVKRADQAKVELASANEALAALPNIQRRMAKLLREQAALEQNYQNFTQKLGQLQTAQSGRTTFTELITRPSALPDPVSPNVPSIVFLGGALGFIVGLVALYTWEARYQPIRTLAHLNTLTLAPVGRVIPELRIPMRGLQMAPPEAYESLAISCLRSGKAPYRIGVVGTERDSGASTTALNMALAFARRGLRVLYVGIDTKPSGKGLLQDEARLDKQGLRIRAIFPENSVLSGAGGSTHLTDEVLDSEADVTIFDFRPTTVSADYAIVATHLDEVLLLVRANRAKSLDVLTSQESLRDSGCPLVQVILTRTSDVQVPYDASDRGDRPTPDPEPAALPM